MAPNYKRLTDSQGGPLLKPVFHIERKHQYGLRVILDGMFWCLPLVNQWRNLPEALFPKWQTDSKLEKLIWHLNRLERKRQC